MTKKPKLSTKARSFLKRYTSSHWRIAKDGSVEIEGDVVVDAYNGSKLPVRFSLVAGSFYVEHCKELTTLYPLPKNVKRAIQITECPGVPESELDIVKRGKEACEMWANSGLKIDSFLEKKRGALKGTKFGI